MRIPAFEANDAPAIIASRAGKAGEAAALPALPPSGAVGPDFGEVLGSFLGKVNAAQQNADQMVEALALGEPVDVHQVMIALGEASNALQMTLQVRNKVLEAYQELMRTPV